MGVFTQVVSNIKGFACKFAPKSAAHPSCVNGAKSQNGSFVLLFQFEPWPFMSCSAVLGVDRVPTLDPDFVSLTLLKFPDFPDLVGNLTDQVYKSLSQSSSCNAAMPFSKP